MWRCQNNQCTCSTTTSITNSDKQHFLTHIIQTSIIQSNKCSFSHQNTRHTTNQISLNLYVCLYLREQQLHQKRIKQKRGRPTTSREAPNRARARRGQGQMCRHSWGEVLSHQAQSETELSESEHARFRGLAPRANCFAAGRRDIAYSVKKSDD